MRSSCALGNTECLPFQYLSLQPNSLSEVRSIKSMIACARPCLHALTACRLAFVSPVSSECSSVFPTVMKLNSTWTRMRRGQMKSDMSVLLSRSLSCLDGWKYKGEQWKEHARIHVEQSQTITKPQLNHRQSEVRGS